MKLARTGTALALLRRMWCSRVNTWGVVLSAGSALLAQRVEAAPGELRAGAELGAGLATRTDVSPTLGARLGYGLENNLELQLEATGVWLRSDRESLATQLVPALAYRFDVVRWVPFVRIGAGPLVTWADEVDVGVLGVGAVGLDYLWDRSLAFNFTYQADFLVVRSDGALPLLPNHRLLFGVTWSSGW